MKHLVLSCALFLSCTAHAGERYIVSAPEGLVQAQALMQTSKTIKPLAADGAVAMDLNEKQAAALESRGYTVEKDHKVYAMGRPSGPRQAAPRASTQLMPWGLGAMSAEGAWTKNGSRDLGKGVTVCVVDSGVDPTHPDLQGQIAGGQSMIKDHPSYIDDHGHGTHVSGTIAALNNQIGMIGVAPGAKIYAVKVLSAEGSGWNSDTADGVRACIGHAQVINMSLGGSPWTAYMQSAITAAQKAGLIIVAAAGNDGIAQLDYPAAYAGVYAVSAVDQYLKLASFSNYGKGLSFAAPGVSILSTTRGGGYQRWNGTSMATPHVAGAFAVMLGARKQTTLQTDNLGLSADRQGRGMPNLLKSIQ